MRTLLCLLLCLLLLPALAAAEEPWLLVGRHQSAARGWVVVDPARGMTEGVRDRGGLPRRSYASVAPNGWQMAWMAREGREWRVYQAPFGTRKSVVVSRLGRADRPPPRWSADSASVLVTRQDPATRMWQVYRVAPDGSKATRLTAEADGAWDPRMAAGRLLCRVSGKGLGDLILVEGGRTRRLTKTAKGVGATALSRDGTRVAWSELLEGGDEMRPKPYRLVVSDALGEAQDRTLLKRAAVLELAWSPDGRWLAVSLPGEVRLLDVGEGGAARTIGLQRDVHRLLDGHGAYAMRWRPDGRALAFSTHFLAQTSHEEAEASTPTREARIEEGDGAWVVVVPGTPVPPLTAAQKATLPGLFEQLDARTYRERERASAALRALGPAAVPLLEAAAKGASAEVAGRLKAIVAHHARARFLESVRPMGWRR